jgi:hypothetical protein
MDEGVPMKSRLQVILSAFLLLVIPACANINFQTSTPSPVPHGPEIRGVFAGNTPCNTQVRSLFQIPDKADCDQIIWSLVLSQDPQIGTPTTYSLKSSYGLSKQGTNGLVDGGTSISMEGKWTITAGTNGDPDAVVYQINPDDSAKTVSFLKVNDDLIHVLSREKSMLVGNGAWSYTLDRMDNQSPTQGSKRSASLPDPPTRPPPPPMPAGSSVFGVFDGRTPCHEVALEFTGTAPFPGCVKIKWRLSLFQDSTSGVPGRYLYMGTSAYREGSWKIVQGKDGNPDAIIYQLQPDGSQQSFYFLKVDNNHLFLMDRNTNLLVGNEYFSYTLSRTDRGAQ